MKKLVYLFLLLPLSASTQSSNDRELWLQYMDKISRPVIQHLSNDVLKEKMPVELAPSIDNKDHRTRVSYLEAFGRTLSGIGPWLNGEGGSATEVSMRERYRKQCLLAIKNSVNPKAKDYMLWKGGQPLVDASFVALGLVRCPWLWNHLDTATQRQVITAFQTTRSVIPVYSNWILFSGMIEAFFCKYGYDYDPVRIEYAIREFANHWYVGDGIFSDGMNFHWDYYNSIVIHPFLANIMDVVKGKNRWYGSYALKLDTINQRYAVLLERMVHTDGSYPITGRSIVYRGGVFHHLSDIAMRKKLPGSLPPAQVRSALTAVIKKTLESPTTYINNEWLSIGLYGKQPALADVYITTGSLYICTTIFAALGLPPTDEFWSGPPQPWTSVRVWRGDNVPADHALDLR
jgi:hypothetical protein